MDLPLIEDIPEVIAGRAMGLGISRDSALEGWLSVLPLVDYDRSKAFDRAQRALSQVARKARDGTLRNAGGLYCTIMRTEERQPVRTESSRLREEPRQSGCSLPIEQWPMRIRAVADEKHPEQTRWELDGCVVCTRRRVDSQCPKCRHYDAIRPPAEAPRLFSENEAVIGKAEATRIWARINEGADEWAARQELLAQEARRHLPPPPDPPPPAKDDWPEWGPEDDQLLSDSQEA